jgi:hypothetical protein
MLKYKTPSGKKKEKTRSDQKIGCKAVENENVTYEQSILVHAFLTINRGKRKKCPISGHAIISA